MHASYFPNKHNEKLIFVEVMADDESTLASLPISKRSQERLSAASAMVITQTTYNGLLRFTGNYMQLMHVLPPSCAAQIFTDLCQLFDFYLCVVYNAFVPLDERQRLSVVQSRMTAPPLQSQKDFEVRACVTITM